MRKINQSIEAYQSGNVFDFDDSIILNYYPRRICELLCGKGSGMEKCESSLLELGLGRGYSAEVFSRFFPDYTVLEGAQEIISRFQEKHPGSGINIIKTYFEDFLPERGRKYDVIVMGFILEHVDSPEDILSRYKDLLADQGRMFLAVPNAESMHRRLGLLAGDLPDLQALSSTDAALGHQRYFTLDSLKKAAEDAGLSAVSAEGLFMKPLATSQMKSLNFSPAYLEAFCRLGKDYPQLSSSILLECRK